jgi:phage-related protein
MNDEKQIRWVGSQKKTPATSKQDKAIAAARYRAVVNARKEKK